MSASNKNSGLGRDFERAINEGMENRNWTTLNDVIIKSVDSFLDSVGDRMNEAFEVKGAVPLSKRKEDFSGKSRTAARQRQLHKEREQIRARMEADSRKREEERRSRRELRSRKINTAELAFPYKNIGTGSSTALMIGGGVGLGVTGVATFASFVKALPMIIGGYASMGGLIMPGILMAAFGLMLWRGIRQDKLTQTAKRFVEVIGSRQYIDIETLALSVNKTKKQVLRDIKKLLDRGYFPQGHLDRSQTTFILTDEVFNHYLELESTSIRNDIIDSTARDVDEQEFLTLTPEESAELSRMIAEGNDYIARFRSLNDDIPGVEISAKLDRLEGLLKEIFSSIRKHPEQMSRIHELMDYYLPTAAKLVAAYREYDRVSEPGKEILEAKQDIENTLDTINAALKKLLNRLFKDSVLDVTTDAQVLKTVLAQKGLATGMESGLKGENK